MQIQKWLPIYFVLFISLALTPACKKFVDIPVSPELIATGEVFQDDKTALSAMNGVYTQMRTASLTILNGGLSVYGSLSADELYNAVSTTTADAFFLNALLPTTSVVNGSFWRPSYQNIYRVNSIIEQLSAAKGITGSVRQQLMGEAKFVRALYYFYLVNLFGEVPLVTGTDYRVNASLPRATELEIYRQIVSDLKEAENLLEPAYPAALRSRPNRWAASALLARAYLYHKDWALAEQAAGRVIGSGTYSLAPITSVFQSSSPETIWQILSENSNTAEGAAFIPSSATVKPPYIISTYLLSAFESNDKRKTSWLASTTLNGQSYFYPFKYKARTSTPLSEYEIVLRYAEVLLIRAEARNEQGDSTGARADLNLVRNRAGLPLVTSGDQAAIALAIEKERQVELFSEWGNRWLDLKRTGRIDQVLSINKAPNWKSTAALFPIPQSEILINVYLTQNPGY